MNINIKILLVLICISIQSFEALNYKYLKMTNKASWWTKEMQDQKLHIKAWIKQMKRQTFLAAEMDKNKL